MRKLNLKSTLVAVGMGVNFAATPVLADPVSDWQAFAKNTGETYHEEWASLIASPEARTLAKEWRDYRGYDATSLIQAADIPEELQPGLVITKDNIDDYPWLSKYLPKPSADRIRDGEWFGWKQVVIVPTNHYYMSRGVLEATREYHDSGRTFTVNEKGELLNQEGEFALLTETAMPFPNPKTGLELAWLFMSYGIGNENLFLNPITFEVCDSDNKLERTYTAHIWWQKMHGRKHIEPMNDVSGHKDVVEAGSVYFLDPYDVRGLAVSRKRYAEADRGDDFRAFLPSLRRTRVLAGSDAQDPMAAGLEVTWDEWRQSWVKPDPRVFEYNIAGEGFVLAQPQVGHAYSPAFRDESGCQIDRMELELRPVWILEVTDKTGNYMYSKRRMYVDKELYYVVYQEMYDQRGNLWRVLDDARDWEPDTGLGMWENYVIWNAISKRWNYLNMDSDWKNYSKDISSQFDIDVLRDYR